MSRNKLWRIKVSDTLQKQMEALAAEHLPATMAGEMSKFLKKADQVEADLAEAIETNHVLINQRERLQNENRILNDQVTENGDLNERAKCLDGREDAIAKREQAIELEVLREKLQNAETTNQKIGELVTKVFGHPNVTVKNEKNDYTYRNGPSGMQEGNDSTNTNETTTTTKGKE